MVEGGGRGEICGFKTQKCEIVYPVTEDPENDTLLGRTSLYTP